ncbi:MAG: protein kinase domain-containing protein [Acidimicrobiales bacterium]
MQQIGKYQVERLLGTGAFASVWLGYDEGLDAQVAIKVLAENWVHDTDVRRRFAEEARILWRLDSDRIVRVHAVDTLADGRPYFVMAFADRGSLADRIDERRGSGGGFSVAEALRFSMDLAKALVVAHELSIVHRDLKPSNVLFRSPAGSDGGGTDERMVLADFGIARSLSGAHSMTIATGTPVYMAPEQAEGRADRRCDIYAAGAILYELLTGSVPFDYPSIGEVILAKLTQAPPRVRASRPEASAALDDLVASALNADPARRPDSAASWAAALEGLTRDVSRPLADTIGPADVAAVRPAGPPVPPSAPPASVAQPEVQADPPGPPGRARRDRQRERTLVGAAAVVGLVAILIALALSGGQGGGGSTPKPSAAMASTIVLVGAAFSAQDPWTTTEAIPEPIPAGLPPGGTGATRGATVSVTAVAGATPGLYGGRAEPVCDVDGLVRSLSSAEVAVPWLAAVGAGTGVDAFFGTLTDVVLINDTRVTSYWRRAAGGVKFQSVLQAGTPVLVDNSGVPRVRCAGGYPLGSPEPAQAAPDYVGDAWAGFDPEAMKVVVAREVVTVFELTDLTTGETIRRPAGRRTGTG